MAIVDPSEATLARERCELHPDRAAVGRCERCGRTVCLDCAIPFRGGVRCERCAAIELGEPEPAAKERRRRFGARHLSLLLLLIALGATAPPWHRSGTLTTRLSAWNFGLDSWAATGCVAVAVAAALMLVSVVRGWATGRSLWPGVLLSCVSGVAIAVTLARAPEFFSATIAPFVALASTILASVLGAFALVRRDRP